MLDSTEHAQVVLGWLGFRRIGSFRLRFCNILILAAIATIRHVHDFLDALRLRFRFRLRFLLLFDNDNLFFLFVFILLFRVLRCWSFGFLAFLSFAKPSSTLFLRAAKTSLRVIYDP